MHIFNKSFEKYILREQFWKITDVLKCIFWGSNFKKSPMLWNVFFEGAILKTTQNLECIFWGSNFFLFMAATD